MIYFDTETTGLPQRGQPLEAQPRIIEIAMAKVNDRLEVTDRYQTLLNPQLSLPEIITKITGLVDDDLRDAPLFADVLPDLVAFCRGCDTMAAHNVSFDQEMLVNELTRCDWQWRFPYPMVWLDTLQFSEGRSLENWSRSILPGFVPQEHRAMADVERLLACVRAYHGR